MTLPEFLEKLETRLSEEISGLQEESGDGQCSDWGAYKKLTGQVLGIKSALDIVKETIKELDEEDD